MLLSSLTAFLILVPFVCASQVINTILKATGETDEGTLIQMEKEKNYAAPYVRKAPLVHWKS